MCSFKTALDASGKDVSGRRHLCNASSSQTLVRHQGQPAVAAYTPILICLCPWTGVFHLLDTFGPVTGVGNQRGRQYRVQSTIVVDTRTEL